MSNRFDKYDQQPPPKQPNRFDKYDQQDGSTEEIQPPQPRQTTGNHTLDFLTGPGTPLGALGDYFGRVGEHFVGGIDRAVQGVGDTVEGGVSRNVSKGNVLTGLPRIGLGTMQAMFSPVSAAVEPILGPLLKPVGNSINENVGKPLEDATGYPADVTNDIVLQMVMAGGAKAIRSVMPKTTPRTADTAERLRRQGVRVFPGQLASSPMVRNAHDLADKLSIYDNGQITAQQGDIARALSRTMGQNTDDLRVAAARANEELSGIPNPQNPIGPKLQPGTYDEVYQRIGDHPVDAVAQQEINTLAQRANGLTPRTAGQVQGAINQIAQVSGNGQISIAAFKDLTDRGGVLSELSGNANPAVAMYGDQLRGILERNIARAAGPADAAVLRGADSRWQHLKTLEPAIARGANDEGHISISRLQSDIATASGRANARNASGMPELESLAEAGQGLLKPPKTSGTAERSAVAPFITGQAVLGGGGYLAGGPVAAIAALLTPPLVRRILQSPMLARAMISEARHRGLNPNAFKRMLSKAAHDAKYTVPAALAVSDNKTK